MRTVTGSRSSRLPASVPGAAITLQLSAQLPKAATIRGSGIASYAISSAGTIWVVIAPVTSRTSAWRGDAVIAMPKRDRSYQGLETAWSSCSQPLHDPASTCRIASEAGASGAGRRILRRSRLRSWRKTKMVLVPSRYRGWESIVSYLKFCILETSKICCARPSGEFR